MPTEFDWTQLAFGSKKEINALRATFIMAPREVSVERFTQLIKHFLPQGNIVVGIAKEEFIAGFEGQPQFRTLQYETITSLIKKVMSSSSKYKVYPLHYFQREGVYIIDKLKFNQVILTNGSWQHSFHHSPVFSAITQKKLPYRLISPFYDEDEARQFAARKEQEIAQTHAPILQKAYTEQELMAIVAQTAKYSFDHIFQTGAVLAHKKGDKYQLLETSFNKVVPYQSYALHHGSTREKNFSPANDMNHYDTIHAEVALILKIHKKSLDLKGTSLFINLMPCPSCTRMLLETEITEIIYSHDHSDGYAVQMLESSGKVIRRLLPQENKEFYGTS